MEQLKDRILLPTAAEIAKERAFVVAKINEIGEKRLREGILAAVDVRKKAYPPYSGYMVGATVICKSGDSYSSCNAEAASYSGTDHAEKSAITKAISSGEIQKSGEEFIEAVIVSHLGASGPCGECRKRIAEHCQNALVLDVDGDGNIQAVTSLKALFFYGFTPSHVRK